ncbi:MAG: DMT family transporter, partial [Pseudomonadales bacterium]
AVVGKLATGQLNAIELTFFRWLIAVIFIFFIARKGLRGDWPLIKRYWKRLSAMAIVGFVGFNLTLYGALHYTSAINVAISQAAIPMVIIALNKVFFGQRAFLLQLIGVSVALFGVALTVSRGNLISLLQGDLNRGDAMMLFAVMCYALYSLSLRYRPEIRDTSFIFALGLASLISMIPLMLWSVGEYSLPHINWETMAIILYVAIFPSFFAQLFYAKGIGMIGANRGGVFINLVPIFGALLAVLVLGEQFRDYHFYGLSLVLGGIALSEWIVKRRAAQGIS